MYSVFRDISRIRSRTGKRVRGTHIYITVRSIYTSVYNGAPIVTRKRMIAIDRERSRHAIYAR